MHYSTRTEVDLRAHLLVGGRRVPATVWSLSLTDVEVDAEDVQPVSRRLGVDVVLEEDEPAVRLTAEISRLGKRSLGLRIVGFSPGARARLERYLDERDTLTLRFVEETPLLLDRPRPPLRPPATPPPATPPPIPADAREPTMALPRIPLGARRVAMPLSIAQAAGVVRTE